MRFENKILGETIELEETEDLPKLRNQLLLLGSKGLFYSDISREIQRKIERLEKSEVKK